MVMSRWLLCGGFMIATCSQLVPALDVEILIPLYEFPNADAGMWADLQDAAQNGHPITGILNPNNGPHTDEGSLGVYRTVLADLMNKGDSANAPGIIPPTLICYVATGFGDTTARPRQTVLDDMAAYQTIFPGVCDGYFFDEAAAAGLTDSATGALTDMGQLFKDYNDAAFAMNMPATFNPGLGADPVYFQWEGFPTVLNYEDYYEHVKTVGMPRPPPSMASSPSQNAMMVHSATELESDDSLVNAMVEKAACAGWGKVFLTGSPFTPNPWDENTVFWDALVAKVSQPITVTCPESAESSMGMMVPLLPNPVPDEPELDAMVDLILQKVSKSDYGDVVSVVLDPSISAMGAKAGELRDAGARVLCFLDADGVDNIYTLSNLFVGSNSNAGGACGGFYVDNFDTSVFPESGINDFYINSQFAVPRGTVVFRPVSEDPEVNKYLNTNDWNQLSFQVGRVIVATVVDGAVMNSIPPSGGEKAGSAVMMRGFTGDAETVECLVADMAAESYGYAYVTDTADFSDLPSYWDDLFEAVTDPPSTPSSSCGDTSPTEPVTACGTEPEATIWWSSNARIVVVAGGGCADMSRISAYLTKKGVTDAIIQVSNGVWELDATINVKVGSTLKIVGQGLGECDELRLVSNSPRSRVLGIGGSIVIKSTQVYGWVDGEVDVVESSDRGYILCRSCASGSSDQCVMSVEDSTIGYLGSGGAFSGGLAWIDTCASPATASARSVTIDGNRRGVYARGVTLEFDNVSVGGSGAGGILVHTCSGRIVNCIVEQPTSAWAILAQYSDGIEITDNITKGSRGIFLANADSPRVTGNTVDLSPTSVRIRTSNTVYLGNAGDGVYDASTSTIGLRAHNSGCFVAPPESGSAEDAVDDYILSKLCTP